MKAAIIETEGAQPVYGEFPEPPAEADREIVQLVAAGIHPLVRSLAAGRHYGSSGQWPLIPGVDAVAQTTDGKLVYTGYVNAPYGTIAERISVPNLMRFELPDDADTVAVAGGLNPGMSSWMPLTLRKADVGALGTVLVLGVTGMAGTLAIQNALELGARRVVGAGRNAERLQRAAALGADVVPLTGDRTTDATALAEKLGEDAPTIVLDFVWGEPAEAAFTALGRRGLKEDDADVSYIEIGALAGAEAALPASLLRSRKIRISGSGAGSGSVSAILRELPQYIARIADGRIQVPTTTFPLSEIAEAWASAALSDARTVVVPD